MAAEFSTTITNPNDGARPFVIVHFTNAIKLTPSNYITWKSQIQATLTGYDLFKFLNGDHPAPPTTLTTNNVTTSNLAFTSWMRQDKLLYGALVGTLDASVAPLVTRATTSKEAWDILARTYANPSKGHINQLKAKLRSSTKGSMSITEYIQSITSTADLLASLGKSVDADDLVSFVLQGLDGNYQSIVDAIKARDTTIHIDDLHEKLLVKELELRSAATNLAAPATTLNAQSRPRTNRQRHQPPSNRSPSTHFRPPPMVPPPQARPFLGKCQWCRETGHIVAYCPLFRQQHPNARPPTLPRTPAPPPTPQAHTVNAASTSQNYIVDSGATHHVVTDLDQLSLHYPYNGPDELFMGSGEGLRITNSVTLSLSTSASLFNLPDTLCVPQMTKNIISVSQLSNQQNCAIVFLPHSFHVKCLKTGRILLNGPCRDGLYVWPSSPTVLSSSRISSPLWHHALGHPSTATFKLIQQQLRIPSPTFEQSDCTSCQLNKSHKLPFYNSSLCSNYFLEVIFSDVWTSPILSYDGFKYYVVFVDHFTRYSWTYPLKRKSDVQHTFIKFRSLVENYFKTKIKIFYSDNGGEFIALQNFLSQNGISHFTSPPHTPEHNGISERKHRHIVETGLALLTHSGMPLEFWPHALLTAVYLINRLPIPTLQNQSPFSIIFKQNEDYAKLKSFGCLCFPWLKPYTAHKLESRSVVCVFVGYSTTQHAYYCMDPKT